MHTMESYFKTVPGKLKTLQILCIAAILFFAIGTYANYTDIRNMYQMLGRDTVPSFTSACSLRATLANANSNAINTFLARDLDSTAFWNTYEKEITKAHEYLLISAQSITYGDEEKLPILSVMAKLADYDRLVGLARGKSGKDYLASLETADRLMRAVILESSKSLGDTNYNHLTETYKKHKEKFSIYILVTFILSLILLIILGGVQMFISFKFRRIINVGLAASTLVLLGFTIYTFCALISLENNLRHTKEDAFDSIYALYTARAISYDASTDETIFLLDYEHPTMKPRRTADFLEKTNMIFETNKIEDALEKAKTGTRFKGYMGDVLANVTYPGEMDATLNALYWWKQYLAVDAQVRQLEEDGRHKDAVALSVGAEENQANWVFKNYDKALGSVITINQKAFDEMITNGFKGLKYFPYILIGVTIFSILGVLAGIKMRMREYIL